MSYEMKLEQGLSQQLNQFQVQSLKILSFDNYELEKFLQDEYACLSGPHPQSYRYYLEEHFFLSLIHI